ncbi:MAG: twin-arginine translocation pathway signal protein [Rubrivivax sp.]|nr:twin-arginine translocation pathway signal protein [Rubrivivax sp.]
MQRRAFVKLVGGGAIVGVSGGVAGCGAAMPDEAIAAWAEAGRNDPAANADPRRWALGFAVLAPHSHNLQSWLVDLSRPGEIELRCDLTRLLPETDPFSRQIMMSQGTFIELLDLALRERGQRAEVTLFPEGAPGPDQLDARPVARIRVVADGGVAKDPLFAQIRRRHTNRAAYDPARPVPVAAWQAMAEAVRTSTLPALVFGHADGAQPERLARHRAIANEAWRIELSTPRTFLESLKVMRVGAAEVARHRDGLTLLDPLPVLMDKLGLFDRSRAPAPDSFVVRGQIDDFAKKMDSTTAFLWLTSEGNDRATQVNAGRAYARVQLAATAAGVVMQPLSQALQEFPEVAGPYAEVHRLLGAERPRQTVQMWARVGHAPSAGPSPRRGVQAHLLPRQGA